MLDLMNIFRLHNFVLVEFSETFEIILYGINHWRCMKSEQADCIFCSKLFLPKYPVF